MSCFLFGSILKPEEIQVVFFGTPEFALPSLEALVKASFCNLKAVVTQPDKPVGRHQSKAVPSPVKKASQRLKLPVFEGLDGLKDIEADLGIVVAYGEILPKWLLDHFPLGIVNIHPSLLPKYRGSSPIQAAILNQDKETGVTLMKLDDKMDHGPIVAQEVVSLRGVRRSPCPSGRRVGEGGQPKQSQRLSTGLLRPLVRPRNDNVTAGELHNHLAEISAKMLIKYLPDYIAGKIKFKPQDDGKASYTKKLTKEDGKIDWKKSPQEIEAHIRAMNPWPGAWTMWKGKRLIIWRASLVSLRGVPYSGRRSNPDASATDFGIATVASTLPRNDIFLEEVQLEGKKRMPWAEFAKGHAEFKITSLF